MQLKHAGAAAGDPIRIPLGSLVNEFYSGSLDSQGDRLLVRRSPGDRLLVSIDRRCLVFSPGETLKFDVQPHLLSVNADTRVRIDVQLAEVRGTMALWSAENVIRAGQPGSVAMRIPLPGREGVYEVAITATPVGWQQTMRSPLGVKPVAERRIQLVVLGPVRRRRAEAAGNRAACWRSTRPIRTGRSAWASCRSGRPLAGLRRGSLGNGTLQLRQGALGPMAELSPSHGPADASWQAYFLSISRPGVPHILEIEYPSNQAQAMGISILEPNAAGALISTGLDSGIDVAPPLAGEGDSPRWLRHRLIFWPRTKSPMVLLTNRSDRLPAAYGKIRVLAGWAELPRAFAPTSQPAERLLAAYLDRPLMAENFSRGRGARLLGAGGASPIGPPFTRAARDWSSISTTSATTG